MGGRRRAPGPRLDAGPRRRQGSARVDAVAERMAALLPAIAGAFAATGEDAFLDEVIRVLEDGRRAL
nr:hypothetical protein [Corynebacterium xerosis]